MKTLEDVRIKAAEFVAKRNWQAFQTPKNLCMALSVEVAELVEHFQWLTEAESKQLDATATQAVTDEIADVQLYLVRIADELGINILDAVAQKTKKNEQKYPVS